MKTILLLFTKYKFIFFAVLFAFLAIVDLINFGIPPTHDGEYHVMRFQQFYKVISEGTLYPRWAPDFNNGFGIPLFNYVYPLPNYLASFFHVLGFGFIDSFKLNMATATIVGAVFMYLWSRKYWGDWGGVVSSVFYTFSPYHFLDIYVRGSVGEVWSLGLAPGLFWAYLNFFNTKKKIFLVLSAILLALLVLAHNILALVFFGFSIAYAGFLIWSSKEKKNQARNLILIIFSGLGLSSPFWLPALFETKYVVGLQIFDPTQHFPVLYKLIYSSWGYGFSGTNTSDQMSFQIGIANLIALLGSIIVLFLSKNRRTLIFFISLSLVTVFLITPFSILLWEKISIMAYIQFPWRLLSLVILIVSFLAGSIVRKRTIIAILLIILSIGLSLRYAKAPFYHKRADQHYLTRSNFTDGTNSPGNAFNTKWLVQTPPKRKEKIELFSGSAKIKITELKSTYYSFTVDSKEKSKILINTAYFPGWTATINGKMVEIENYQGKMLLSSPRGYSTVHVWIDNTVVQKISYAYFLVSILILALLRIKTPGIIKK